MELLKAAMSNDISEVAKLLDEGSNVNVTNICHQTALYLSCRFGHSELTELLLSCGADPNFGVNPLIAATSRGHRKCVQTLIQYGADVNAVDRDGWSAVHVACQHKDYVTMQLLIASGADVNKRCEDKSVAELLFRKAGHQQSELIETLLDKGMVLKASNLTVLAACRYAFRLGLLEFAQKMLAIESDDNIQHHYSFALCACAVYNWTSVAKELLDRGVEANSFTDHQTALYYACREEHVDMVDLLLQHGADPNVHVDGANSAMPVEAACLLNNTAIASRLLSHSATVDKCYSINEYDSSLHQALAAGNLHVCELLMSRGANVNCVDGDDLTLLHRAAQRCNIDAVKWLLKHNADVNAVNEYKLSVLHVACGGLIKINAEIEHENCQMVENTEICRLAVVNLLVENGADINAKFVYCRTALYLACYHGYSDVVRLLLASGAKLDAVTHISLRNPLVTACVHSRLEIVELLLLNGADVNTAGFYNKSKSDGSCCQVQTNLLCIAIDNHCQAVVELLLRYSAVSVHKYRYHSQVPLLRMVYWLAASRGTDSTDSQCSHCDGHSVVKRDRRDTRHDSLWNLFRKFLEAVDVKIDPHDAVALSLCRACSVGLVDAVEIMIECGANVNKTINERTSPLYIACSKGYEDIVRLLLDNNADVTISCPGDDALIVAASRIDNLPIVAMLISRGIDVNMQTIRSETALHVARSRPVAEALIAAGADPNVITRYGPSPLYVASKAGYVDVVDVLLRSGAYHIWGNSDYIPLFAACEQNHVDVVRLLLDHGFNPEFPSCHIWRSNPYVCRSPSSALCIACDKGHVDIVRLLLNFGASVNFQATSSDETPLLYALYCVFHGSATLTFSAERLCIIDLLLEHKADVNAQAESQMTPLFLACRHGLVDVVSKLLALGASVNPSEPTHPHIKYIGSSFTEACKLNHCDVAAMLLAHDADCVKRSEMDAALRDAARAYNIDVVKFLVKCGANVNWLDSKGKTALHHAVCQHVDETKDIIKVLVLASANIDMLTKSGETALGLACRRGKRALPVVDLLLANGADPDLSPGAALSISISNGCVPLSELLLMYGASPYYLDEHKRTVLHQVLSQWPKRKELKTLVLESERKEFVQLNKNCISLLKLFLSVGVDMNALDNSCRTILFMAVKKTLTQVVRLLLKHGADPNKPAHKCPLAAACSSHNVRMVQLLLDSGARAGIKPHTDYTYQQVPLFIASVHKPNVTILKMLLDYGADVNMQDAFGQTPLHRALDRQDKTVAEVTDVLLERGANSKCVSKSGLSALHVACLHKAQNVVEKLLLQGADPNQTGSRVRPLMFACRDGDIGILELLLNKGADPKLHSLYADRTIPRSRCGLKIHNMCAVLPLSAAVCKGQYKTAELFIKHGAVVNAVDGTGKTALHALVTRSRRLRKLNVANYEITLHQMLKLLLDNGADVNILNVDGETALYSAAAVGRVDIISELISHGAIPNLTTTNTYPLCAACLHGHLPAVRLLLKAGASVNPQVAISHTSRMSRTPTLPLGAAASGAYASILGLLLSSGAEVNALDSVGCTALHRACNHFKLYLSTHSKRGQHCIEMLLNHGADANVLKPTGRSALRIVLSALGELQSVRQTKQLDAISGVIDQLVQHGASLDIKIQPRSLLHQNVAFLDLLTMDSSSQQFASRFLKAGASFSVLSVLSYYSEQMTYAANASSRIVMCKTAVLAGYHVTESDIALLQISQVATSDPMIGVTDRVTSQKAELLRWLNEQQPLTLMAQCRIAVRRQLSVANGYCDITGAVTTLPLPLLLKDYMMFEGRLCDVELSCVADGEIEEREIEQQDDDSSHSTESENNEQFSNVEEEYDEYGRNLRDYYDDYHNYNW